MANKLNIDDFIKNGYALGPDETDPQTGKVVNTVYNLKDLDKDIHNIHIVYKDLTKFKGASNENIKNLAKKVCSDLSQTVRDIKELKAHIELIRQKLYE